MIDIIGHSDRAGDAQLNDALALQRAQSVKAYLVDHNITLTHVSVVSHGENDPLIFTKDGISEPKSLLKSWVSLVDINTPPKDLHKYSNPAIIYHKGTLSVFTTSEYKNAKLLKIIKCVNSEPIDLGPK